MPSSDKTYTLYKRLLGYAFRYKAYLLISVLGFILFATMEAFLVRTVEFFIDYLEKKPNESLSFIPTTITQSIFFVPLLVLILSFIRGLGSFLGNFFMGRVGLSVVNTLRKDVFNHMMHLPQSYFDNKNSGENVSLIIYNVEQVTGSVTNAVKTLLRDGFSLLGFLGLMLYYSWQLTLVFLVTTPILAGLIYLASRYFRHVSRRIQKTVGSVTHIATESLQGIKLVKSYNGEAFEKARFARAADENFKYGLKFERVRALQTPILHCVIASALAVIFLLVSLFWDGSSAAAIAYISAAGLISKPFRQLSSLNATIQKGMAAAETIFSTLDHETETDTGQYALTQTQGEIRFNHVHFNYSPSVNALNNVSFTIKPGETVAFVGRSGSGKTTIANLLLRFYTPSSGSITLDGIPLNDITLKSLRNTIGFVNQQTVLFNESIRDNIAYGAEVLNEDRLIHAAKNASAYEFIQNLPQAFNSQVGESGDRLSGGQRQRLAIARAVYKDSPILLLDEATSALDNESEKAIQEALETLSQHRTTLIIAHRLSTIQKADKIIVLDDGQLVEIGSHDDLLSKNGHYANLYQTQFSKGE